MDVDSLPANARAILEASEVTATQVLVRGDIGPWKLAHRRSTWRYWPTGETKRQMRRRRRRKLRLVRGYRLPWRILVVGRRDGSAGLYDVKTGQQIGSASRRVDQEARR